MQKNKLVKLFKRKVTATQWNEFYSQAFNYVYQSKTDDNKVIISFWADPDDVSEECIECTMDEAKVHHKVESD